MCIVFSCCYPAKLLTNNVIGCYPAGTNIKLNTCEPIVFPRANALYNIPAKLIIISEVILLIVFAKTNIDLNHRVKVI